METDDDNSDNDASTENQVSVRVLRMKPSDLFVVVFSGALFRCGPIILVFIVIVIMWGSPWCCVAVVVFRIFHA